MGVVARAVDVRLGGAAGAGLEGASDAFEVAPGRAVLAEEFGEERFQGGAAGADDGDEELDVAPEEDVVCEPC